MSALQKIDKWVRVKTLPPIIVLFLSAIVAYGAFFDRFLQQMVENHLSVTNGARVDIGSLSFSLFKGKLRMSEIQITHPSNPQMNIFEIDEVELDFDPKVLLRKKVMIPEIRINGIQSLSRRARTGVLPRTQLVVGVPGIFERAHSTSYHNLRDKLRNNPLKRIDKLAKGFSFVSEIGTDKENYKSYRKLSELNRDLKAATELWKSAQTRLIDDKEASRIAGQLRQRDLANDAQLQLSDQKLYLRETLEKLTEATDNAALDLQRVNKLVAEDAIRIKTKLDLPTFESDLSYQLMGSTAITFFERLTYWIVLSRDRMTKLIDRRDFAVASIPAARGYNLHYGKGAPHARFLIHQISIQSEHKPGTHYGNISGTITNLTTDPALIQESAKGILFVDFPHMGIRGLSMNFELDHTTDVPMDKISGTLENTQIENFVLHDSGNLKIAINKAIVNGTFQATFKGQQADAQWDMMLTGTEFVVDSIYNQVGNELRDILGPIFRFPLTGHLWGSLASLELDIDSPIGKQLNDGLSTRYRHELAAIDKSIEDYIETLIGSQHKLVASEIALLQDTAIPALSRSLAHIDSLL